MDNSNSFRNSKIIQKQLDKKEREFSTQISENADNKKNLKQRKNKKLEEKIIPKDRKEKSPHRQSSRPRNQSRKDYKTFIPQPKILKIVKFQKAPSIH